ncbi:helix-turn-helix domain-containing protein [Mycobacteroides chelonae]|uniref:helix-turn-helix domain-containing protein n=1 Tax=Mycobacteroides chelonae TaxID=1774 RepID=UPI001F440890|nr:helix-turn-helix transcriptional regulator [Mycobacteroides chelonae]
MSALAPFLKNQLESRGWTQSELARRCGLSRQHVSRLLTRQSVIARRRLPSDETFAKLADGLGIPEATLRQSISFPESRSPDSVKRQVTG